MVGIRSMDIGAVTRLLSDTGDGTAAVRQDTVYGIGRSLAEVGDPSPLLDILVRSLMDDPSAPVRRAAAISLGKGGHKAVVEGLGRAIASESDPGVRSSILLALGALGGSEAVGFLESVEPVDAEEGETLRKALEKARGRRVKRASWVGSEPLFGRVLLEVPRGLEPECAGYCADKGIESVNVLRDGMLAVQGPVAVSGLLDGIRCCYGLRIPLGAVDGPMTTDAVGALVRGFTESWDWRGHVDTGRDVLAYRFSVDGAKTTREGYMDLLGAVRDAASPSGMVDSPSDYDIELIIAVGDGVELHMKPSFVEDKRFRYRVEDVGASINPAIAAVLARLVHTGPKAVVLDPTCGSGTLLVERYLYDRTRQAVGIDISGTAINAMKANLRKAGLLGVVRPVKGDAADPSLWPDCDEVVANLPFGVRVKGEGLPRLYRDIVRNAAARLRFGGRLVLYTAARRYLEEAVESTPGFVTERRLLVHAGGLTVHLWVLRRDAD